MDTSQQHLTCPFCGYDAAEYGMLLHMEEKHPETGESPFVARGGDTERALQPSYDDRAEYVECPLDDCDEILAVDEMDAHLQIHAQLDEADDLDSLDEDSTTPVAGSSTTATSYSPARSQRSASRSQRSSDRVEKPHEKGKRSKKNALAIRKWADIFKPKSHHKKRSHREKPPREVDDRSEKVTGEGLVQEPSPIKRLGKGELGRYHNEKAMPPWLVAHLAKNWGKRQEGVIPVLARFLEQSPDTKCAYLCDPVTEHVSRLKTEGSFCGYRNIQTLSSYIVNSRYPGHQRFKGRLPSVFEVQDIVEAAWDRGINNHGRIETGGIKGTRKFIGTPEAQAMLLGMGIECEAIAYKSAKPGQAKDWLLKAIEQYFEQGIFDPELKLRQTTLPPIYFQHPGHSLTIVGIQRTMKDELHLLVFDPSFQDAHVITRNIGREFRPRFPDTMLKPYRRGTDYLKQYSSFEILKLVLSQPTA